MIVRALRATARAVAGRTNAPALPGNDFNREMTDSEMSRIVGGDPAGAPPYGNAGDWWEVATEEQAAGIAQALARRRDRYMR